MQKTRRIRATTKLTISCASLHFARHRRRFDAINGQDIAKSTCKKVSKYIKKHKIGEKMSSRGGATERWNKEDKEFDFQNVDENDRPYMKMPDSTLNQIKPKAGGIGGEGKFNGDLGRNASYENLSGQNTTTKKIHKEEFSLLF